MGESSSGPSCWEMKPSHFTLHLNLLVIFMALSLRLSGSFVFKPHRFLCSSREGPVFRLILGSSEMVNKSSFHPGAWRLLLS